MSRHTTPVPPPRGKKKRFEYVRNHFRYSTMNSWNQAHAPARDVKVHHLGLDREIEDRAFEMLDVDDIHRISEFNRPLDDWQQFWHHSYQWGSNGRSGGYIVMYHGGIKPAKDGYKRFCEACGQGNYRQESNKCGRCGHEPLIDYPFVQTQCWPGRPVFDDFYMADYEEMKDELDIEHAFEVVYSFDVAVDWAIDNFVEFCKVNRVEEEEYLVAKTRRVPVGVSHADD